MIKYKYPYGAVWLSHSSITDFDKCPRLYFLKNVYKEISSNKKIQIVNPYLTLGMVVHDTIEEIRYLPKNIRFQNPLVSIFNKNWEQISGKKGGFISTDQEEEFKKRGTDMINRVQNNPGPLANLSTIIKKKEDMVASMLLSEENNLVLCGNVDWVEVLPDGSLHIIDFKTGKHEESSSSLQLQIYLLLAKNGNKRPVSKLSYWYLGTDGPLKEIPIPDTKGITETLIDKGKMIKTARQSSIKCKSDGCVYCSEYEEAISGNLEKVGYDEKREKILYFKNL